MPNDAQQYMTRAIELAKLGHGSAEPNPMVGCVIVDDNGNVVGEGFHEKFGDGHAEVNALKMAGKRASNATAYVTLEPCNHEGKTPPCALALLEAGVRKVVVGSVDPHQLSTGGIQTLQDAGIEVDVLNDSSCNMLIAPFARRVNAQLPWVICKWAQTVDGSTVTPEDESPWISCEESLKRVHEERGCVDAILVGVNTVIEDNPTLTPRGVEPRRIPIRIVLDPSLRSPIESNIFNSDALTLLVHSDTLDASHYPCKAIPVSITEGECNLDDVLNILSTKYDVTNLIVEGGAQTIQRLVKASLANEFWVFKNPLNTNCDSYFNMNKLVEQTKTSCVLQRPSGVDTEFRYLING